MLERLLAALERPEAAVGGRRLELLEIDARREDALTAGRVQAAVDADLGEQVGAALLETARRVHDAVAVDGAGPALRAVLEAVRRCDGRPETSTIESYSAAGSLDRSAVLVVDPQAYTPWYDHALCEALAARGHDVELVTAAFMHGIPPAPNGYRRREAFGPALKQLVRARPRSPLRAPLKLAGHAAGLASLERAAGGGGRTSSTGSGRPSPSSTSPRCGTSRRAGPSSPRTTCCRAAARGPSSAGGRSTTAATG